MLRENTEGKKILINLSKTITKSSFAHCLITNPHADDKKNKNKTRMSIFINFGAINSIHEHIYRCAIAFTFDI